MVHIGVKAYMNQILSLKLYPLLCLLFEDNNNKGQINVKNKKNKRHKKFNDFAPI